MTSMFRIQPVDNDLSWHRSTDANHHRFGHPPDGLICMLDDPRHLAVAIVRRYLNEFIIAEDFFQCSQMSRTHHNCVGLFECHNQGFQLAQSASTVKYVGIMPVAFKQVMICKERLNSRPPHIHGQFLNTNPVVELLRCISKVTEDSAEVVSHPPEVSVAVTIPFFLTLFTQS